MSTDPTRTSTIRTQFSGAARSRFTNLRNAAVGYLLSDSFNFALGTFAVGEFMEWLTRTEEETIFGGNNAAWMVPFINGAIRQGTSHADRTVAAGVKKFGMTVQIVDMDPSFIQPELDIIYAQNFRLLQGITEVMNLQIKEKLTAGMHFGLNPREVGKDISDRILSIGRTRAEVLARTETIRAHAEATLNRFELYGINKVNGQAELITARDSRVCPACKAIDGNIYTLAEARGLIPVHPRCRCAWLPVIDKFSIGTLRLNVSRIPSHSFIHTH